MSMAITKLPLASDDITFEQYLGNLIKYGEQIFKEKTEAFPFQITVGLENEDAAMLALQSLAEDNFVAFPNDAIGQYKNCIHCIYFKTKRDLVLFKLAYDTIGHL